MTQGYNKAKDADAPPLAELHLDGSVIDTVLVTPFGVRIYRKNGGRIDVTSRDKEQKRQLFIELNKKEIETQQRELDKK